ncbi:MAG TPA: hypothetical protein PKA41_10690 [Verrucomicrobiota bacterium]|nr:hypothetical protein [Verrucomicrobiota bacterium]
MKTNIVLLLQFAGVLHLGLIAAGLLMLRVVNMRSHVAALPPFLGRLFWVYYGFIALCLVSFGAASFFLAPQLATGSILARAVCAFLALFWTVRLFVAAFVFDVSPYLTSGFHKLGYHATNVVFALLPVIYCWAALAGGAP